jgi:CBS domain-containing protein
MHVRKIMSSPVVTVTAGTPVKEAALLLSTHRFTALPVLDEHQRLAGVLTEADVVRDRFPRDSLHRDPRHPAATVGEVMTSPALTVEPDTDAVDLVALMLEHQVRSVPVVEDGAVVGVVTRRDLLSLLARDDGVIAGDIDRRLIAYSGHDRWQVAVHDGAAMITDRLDDPSDRHVAAVLADAVPGVTSVSVHHLSELNR